MADNHVECGRLALRVEGDYWCAYYARAGTMMDAVLLGSIAVRVAEAKPLRKSQFQALMTECVGDIIEHIHGVRPSWGHPVKAPEGERSGEAS